MKFSNLQIITLYCLGLSPRAVVSMASYMNRVLPNARLDTPGDYAAAVNLCLRERQVRRGMQVDTAQANVALTQANYIMEEAQAHGVKMVNRFQARFPKKMINAHGYGKKGDCCLLFYRGDLDRACAMPGIAIVGTRNPSRQGTELTTLITEEAVKQGFNIISGLARGCDTIAHRVALARQGTTTAFLAHGFDTVYPPENRELMEQIEESGGLVASEYPMHERMTARSFIMRDRLQAALSDAVVVVEAGEKSGSKYAFKAAQEMNRETFITRLSADFSAEHESSMLSLFDFGPIVLTPENTAEALAQLKKTHSGK